MIWQFTGVGPHNKGAELMFLAMREKVFAMDPEAKIAMLPASATPFDWRAQHGLWQVFDPRSSGRLGWLRERLFSAGHQQNFGMVDQGEVDVVLDASGYAMGDPWKPEWIEATATYYERLSRQGTKIVLLPQALGPFRDDRVRDASRRVLAVADLAFARDSESFEHASELSPEIAKRLRRAPDFTNLIKGCLPTSWSPLPDKHVAVIPNRKMLDQTDETTRAQYRVTMADAMKQIHREGMQPFVLVHEISDRELAEEIATLAELPGAVEEFSDPLELKGILGNCAYSVGSRFHGLISCLSQGVPAIGTSWSHKYQHLFEDYTASDLLVHSPADFDRSISRLGSEVERTRISSDLKTAAEEQKTNAETMWKDVDVALSA